MIPLGSNSILWKMLVSVYSHGYILFLYVYRTCNYVYFLILYIQDSDTFEIGSLIGMIIGKLDDHVYQRGIMLILFISCLYKPSRRECQKTSRNCDESFYPEDQSMQTIYNNVR